MVYFYRKEIWIQPFQLRTKKIVITKYNISKSLIEILMLIGIYFVKWEFALRFKQLLILTTKRKKNT